MPTAAQLAADWAAPVPLYRCVLRAGQRGLFECCENAQRVWPHSGAGGSGCLRAASSEAAGPGGRHQEH